MKYDNQNLVTKNRKAYHDFTISEEYEAGIALLGTEVKSIRNGQINLKDSYAKIKNDEVFLVNCHISPYFEAGKSNHEPERERKLLLKKREIRKIKKYIEEKGNTLVPLRVYITAKGLIKIAVGMGQGKKNYDKRTALAEKQSQREIDRIRKDIY
ncbi:MAG: SsrA-binding protein SmpB [Candidatus Marinimicrobia bacterium]|nr:SsrA-binding protein SmpB [Candidatus Neomarinimicrobiota bacterium]